MKMHLYTVVAGDDTLLVEAPNKQRALNHVARNRIKVSLASQMEIAELVGNGVEIIKVSESAGE